MKIRLLMKPNAKAVLWAIYTYGTRPLPVEELAQLTDLHAATVKRQIGHLKAVGYISTFQSSKTQGYTFVVSDDAQRILEADNGQIPQLLAVS